MERKEGGIGAFGMERLVALGRIPFYLRNLDRRRRSFCPGVFRARCPARICGTLQRRNAPAPAILFLPAPSPASLGAVELAPDWVGVCCVEVKDARLDRVSPYQDDVAGNILAARLGP